MGKVSGFSQNNLRISIQADAVKVESVLKSISSQTDLEFSYHTKLIDKHEHISIAIDNIPLDQALGQLCAQLDLSYDILENQIILFRSDEELEYKQFSGYIYDNEDGERLIDVYLFDASGKYLGESNEFGFYSVALKKSNSFVDLSYLGYKQKRIKTSIPKSVSLDIVMERQPIGLSQVEIASSKDDFEIHKSLSNEELKVEEFSNLPELGGENGLIKSLQTRTGIKQHSDGSAFYYVRGGARDQNLIIIDDAPLYNPSHLFGFYSYVAPEFTKKISVYKSNIPVKYGDRLSSITDIRTRDGNLNRFSFSASVNPLILQAGVEFPIVKEKASMFLSLRRSNLGWLYRRNSPQSDISFSDLNMKLNARLNQKNRIYFTLILSGDNFTDSPNGAITNSGIKWLNLSSTFRWNHTFGNKLFLNSTLHFGAYAYRMFAKPNFWSSSLGTGSLKFDFTYYQSVNHTFNFGLESQGFFIDPGSSSINSSISLFSDVVEERSQKTALFIKDQYRYNDKLTLDLGLRLIGFSNLGPRTYYSFDEQYELEDTTVVKGQGSFQDYINFDPRISATYKMDSLQSVQLSIGRYHQYLQLISNSISPFSGFEVWLPSSPNIKPQSAWQVSFDYYKLLSNSRYALSASLYSKWFQNQIDYVPHAVTLLNPLIEGELRFGSMHSYGLELEKKFGKLNGWLSYALTKTQRQTDLINGGQSYAAFQDRPHDLSLMINYLLKPRLFLSAYYTWVSGNRFSSPTAYFQFQGQEFPVLGEKHNDRLPNYSRLDLALRWILNKNAKSKLQHELNFSIYNFLANKNSIDIDYSKSEYGDDYRVPINVFNDSPLVSTQRDLLRFFPSITYKVKL